jgi:histidinol-phosphate aminotransferase
MGTRGHVVSADAEIGAVSASLRMARETLRDVIAYPSERVACAIDLSDNTNIFGAPPSAVRLWSAFDSEELTRYPGLQTVALRAALAEYSGVVPNELVTACGSDDVIDCAVRAFAEPGEALAYSDPTFTMIPVFGRVNGLTPVPVPFRLDWDIDADGLVATGARIIYVCSPNNPTGTAVSRAAIERVIERAPGIVIIDEAYAEFCGAGMISVGPSLGRVLVTRTLSKAWGMAGLRIGYGTGAAEVITAIEKVRGPYKVNAPGERAAAGAICSDQEWMRNTARLATEIRDRFVVELRSRGMAPLTSVANFVLVPVDDAVGIARRMRDLGVAVRPLPALAGIGDALRIGVGPWEMMERALQALLAARA